MASVNTILLDTLEGEAYKDIIGREAYHSKVA
jgi:hypothetical protein